MDPGEVLPGDEVRSEAKPVQLGSVLFSLFGSYSNESPGMLALT